MTSDFFNSLLGYVTATSSFHCDTLCLMPARDHLSIPLVGCRLGDGGGRLRKQGVCLGAAKQWASFLRFMNVINPGSPSRRVRVKRTYAMTDPLAPADTGVGSNGS